MTLKSSSVLSYEILSLLLVKSDLSFHFSDRLLVYYYWKLLPLHVMPPIQHLNSSQSTMDYHACQTVSWCFPLTYLPWGKFASFYGIPCIAGIWWISICTLLTTNRLGSLLNYRPDLNFNEYTEKNLVSYTGYPAKGKIKQCNSKASFRWQLC